MDVFLSFPLSPSSIHNNKQFPGVYSIISGVWRYATILVCQLIGVESLGGVCHKTAGSPWQQPLAATSLQEQQLQHCPRGGQQRSMQRELHRQGSKATVKSSHTLLAAD